MTPSLEKKPDWLRLEAEDIFKPIAEAPALFKGLGFYREGVCVLAGASSTGKTWAGQSLLVASAAGMPVWSLASAVKRVRALYVDLEQGEYMSRGRFQQIAAGLGVGAEQLRGTLGLRLRPRVLLDQAEGKRVWRAELAGAEIVLIDSLRASMPSLDENDSRVRGPLDALNEIAQDNKQAIVLIHHLKKNVGPQVNQDALRGSSAIFDAVSSVYALARTDDGGRLLTPLKDRYRELPGGLVLELQAGGDGRMVVVARPAPGQPAARRDLRGDIVEALLDEGAFVNSQTLTAAVRGRKKEVLASLRALEAEGIVVKNKGYRLSESFLNTVRSKHP